MTLKDTARDTPGREFPSTNWSDILAVANPSSSEFRERMDGLLRTYWKPVFAYIRTGWKRTIEDAKDLTQAFFTHLLEKGYISNIKPTGGTFRGYLKVGLKHFLIDVGRSEKARRPDTGRYLVSFDASAVDLERLGAAIGNQSPEEVYDAEWSRGLLWEAIRTLEELLKREGKERYFQVFKGYCLDPEIAPATIRARTLLRGGSVDSPTYDELARQLDIKKSDVRNYLSHCRTRLQQILLDRIRDYVATDDDVYRELRALFRG